MVREGALKGKSAKVFVGSGVRYTVCDMPEETEHGFYKVSPKEDGAARTDAQAEEVAEGPETVPETPVEAPRDALEQKVARWEPGKFIAQKEKKVGELNKTAATYDDAAERTGVDVQAAERALAQVGREVGPDVGAKVDAEIGEYREKAGEARGNAAAVDAEFNEFGVAREQAVEKIAGELEKKGRGEGKGVESLNGQLQKVMTQLEKLRTCEAIMNKRESEAAKLDRKSLQGKVSDDLTRRAADVANIIAKLEAQRADIEAVVQRHEVARQVLKKIQAGIRL